MGGLNYRAFLVDGTPVAKGRPRVTRRGFTYTPKETKEQEQKIKDAYLKAYGDSCAFPEGVPLKLQMVFYMPMPKSLSKKKRLAAVCGDLRPTKKPDVDNLIKVIDALNGGVAFADDSQIVEIHATKYYSEHPSTMIIISEIRNEDKTKESTPAEGEARRETDKTQFDCMSR